MTEREVLAYVAGILRRSSESLHVTYDGVTYVIVPREDVQQLLEEIGALLRAGS